MLIATILLIANLVALVWKGQVFMSFWWNFFAYLIEIGLYLLIGLIITVIGWIVVN